MVPAMTTSREIVLEGNYLNVPVKVDAPRRTLRLRVGGQVVRAFEVELADAGAPDFWVCADVSAWRGQTMALELDARAVSLDEEIRRRALAHPVAAGALDGIEAGDEIKEGAEIYHEALRPQFHFTARRGHLNDPNGLMYHAGEYHLFYQHDPYGVYSSPNKAWGHAVSRDLVHWTELPVALHADEEGNKWSGSGVVDTRNDSGLRQGDEPPMLVFYTATGFSAQHPEPGPFVQAMAFSHDHGRSWQPYAGNPILPNVTPGNRDPLVFWHEPTQRWIMTLFVGQPESWKRDGNRCEARLYSSTNLRDWRHESTVGGFFDCPVLFELPLDGDTSDPRWIMHCADMKYRVGRFDGHTFTPESELLVGQRGDCAYAAQLFNHAPDGRRIQLAWGRTEAPGMPFSQMMCFPCDLSLVSTPAGPRLRWAPVPEIACLQRASVRIEETKLTAGAEPMQVTAARLVDLRVVMTVGAAAEIALGLGSLELVIDVAARQLRFRQHTAPLALAEGRLTLRVLWDRISLEVFADDGLVYLPLAALAGEGPANIALRARGGDAMIEQLVCYELASIWSRD